MSAVPTRMVPQAHSAIPAAGFGRMVSGVQTKREGKHAEEGQRSPGDACEQLEAELRDVRRRTTSAYH